MGEHPIESVSTGDIEFTATKNHSQKEIKRREIESHVAEFFAAGGKAEILPPAGRANSLQSRSDGDWMRSYEKQKLIIEDKKAGRQSSCQ